MRRFGCGPPKPVFAARMWEAARNDRPVVTPGEALLWAVFSPDGCLPPAFNPDGKRVVTVGWADQRPKVRDLDPGSELFALASALADPFSVAFGPDGKRIVVGGRLDNALEMCDAVTGLLLVTIPHADAGQVAFSPDGRFLHLLSPDALRFSRRLDPGAPGGK